MKYVYILIIYILIISASLSAQTSDNQLMLKDFLIQTCKNSHFEYILIDELFLEYDEILASQLMEILLNIRSSYSLVIGEDLKLPEGSISLSAIFPETGTSLEAGYSQGTSFQTDNQTGAFSLRFEQAILGGGFGKTAKLKNIAAAHQKTIAKYKIVEAYETYLSSIILIYIEWLSAYQNKLYAESAYRDSVAILDLVKKKLQYNIALPVELNKSELQVLSKEEQLEGAQQSYKSIFNEIQYLSGIDVKGKNLIPSNSSLPEAISINRDDILKQFKTKSRTARTMNLLTEILNIDLQIARDTLKPKINIYADYSLDNIWSSLENSFEFGITVDLSFLNTKNKTSLRSKEVEIRKESVKNNNDYSDIYEDVVSLLDQFEYNKRLLSITEKKKEAAELILKEEQKEYDKSRAELNDILTAQNSLDNIEKARILLVMQQVKLTVEWLEYNDILVDDNYSQAIIKY